MPPVGETISSRCFSSQNLYLIKKYGQTYEEFLKNARELTGIKDAEEALDKAYNFLIEATLLVYKVEK